MKFYIHEETVKNHKSNSGKAIYFTPNYYKAVPDWFPLSQLKIGNYNECGWAIVDIPDWLIRQKGNTKGYRELEVCEYQ